MIVLRVDGNEPYHRIKVKKSLANKLEEAGWISNYNEEFGYVEGDYKQSLFKFEGYTFKIEYFSGCFNPFLLMLK